jgi:pimeloyl-ACP methyl ester carboxylesterase
LIKCVQRPFNGTEVNMENVAFWRMGRQGQAAALKKDEAGLTPGPASATHQHQEYPNGGEGWVRPGRSPDAVVFVHGFTGHFHATWTWTPSRWGRFWRKECDQNLLGSLLASEPDLSCDYYSFSHSSANFDVNGVRNLADALRTFLDTTVANGSERRRVVLVSHSLGGVLCRQAALNLLDPNVKSRVRIVGLLMMGTPNLGTEVARIALRSKSAANIKPWDDYLDELNREWLRRVVNGGDPDLEPAQRIRLKCGVLYGLTDRVVPAASAKSGVYLGELHAVNKGHIDLPKCETKGDPVYGVLRQFIKDSLAEDEWGKLKQSVDNLSYRVRQGILDPRLEWTYQESELIELTPHPAMAPQVLDCKITSTRIGWEPQPEITVCLRLEGIIPPKGIHVDFGYLFGRGALTEEEYADLGDSLRTASLKKEELDRLLRVEAELWSTDSDQERSVVLKQPELNTGPGYACLRHALEQPGSVGRNNRLKLTLHTTLRRHQAWYGFRSTRTVLGEAELQLTAPFPVYPLSRIWWSEAQWQQERLGAKSFSSKVTIPGPLPVGTDVIWMFEPEAYRNTNGSEGVRP